MDIVDMIIQFKINVSLQIIEYCNVHAIIHNNIDRLNGLKNVNIIVDF